MRERSGAARKERLRSVFAFASEAARATEQAALFLRCIHPLRFDERKDLDEECTRYDAFLKEKRKNAVGKEHRAHGTADCSARDLAVGQALQSRNGLRLRLTAAGADALLFALCAVRRLPGHRPFAEIMPEGRDGLLFLERFAADGALLAVRKAVLRAGRRFSGDRFGRMSRTRAVHFFFAGEQQNRASPPYFSAPSPVCLTLGKEPCVRFSAQGGRCAARPLRGRSRSPAS